MQKLMHGKTCIIKHDQKESLVMYVIRLWQLGIIRLQENVIRSLRVWRLPLKQ